MRVSVIIPTHNEAQAIGRVLADLPADLTTEVIVVDSNSNDGTPEIAARMGARVVREPRRGYGRACLTGLAEASSPDVVVFLDGDYSDRPSELPMILGPIADGRADLTIGSRLRDRRCTDALPWHQVFGNRLAAGLIRLLYGVKITDLGPFRAGRADVLRSLGLEEMTYGWAVEMILKGALAGFRIVEVPVSYHPPDREIEDQRYGERHAGCCLVHSQLDRALLFPASKSWGATTHIGPASLFMKPCSEVVAPSSDRVLVIMAKAPRPGAVKTRLISSLSPEAVTDFYCCLFQDTLALARSLGDVDVAIMCPDSDLGELMQLAGNRASVLAQTGEGLAAGLTCVFAHFAASGPRRIIAFNSDSPHLPRSVLEEAFEKLAAHDVVVGPTQDGGYYLVGAKASRPALFANDGMGTTSALERLLTRARHLQLSVGFADSFYDIDVADDLIRLSEELRLAPARAPRTAQWLREWERTAAQSRRGSKKS